jgi:hypothetical protein
MVFFSCTSSTCPFVGAVHALDEGEADGLIGTRSDWYPDRYPCPLCGSTCVINTRKLDERKVSAYLTPQEAFIAFSGAGLPSECECSAAAVRALLCGASVKLASTRHIQGTNRCTIDFLELMDGTRLYLGSSTHGACVYRVQKPHSYVEGG